MGLDIVTNTMATEASNAISQNQGMMQGALGQLSSGYRINSPADDASGYVISQHLQAQISGFQQAQANTQAGINVVQTADGALQEVSSILQTINSLAVQSANSSATDTTAQAADQAEVNQALSSIVDIAQTTVYGNKQLLVNGTATTVSYTFQVGNDNSAASQVTFSLAALNLANLGLVNNSLSFAAGSGVTNITGTGLGINSTYAVSVTSLSTAGVASGAVASSFQSTGTTFAGATFSLNVNGVAALVTIAANATIGALANAVSAGLAAASISVTAVTVSASSTTFTLTDATGGAAGTLAVGGVAANLTALGLTAGTFAGTSSVAVGGSTVTVTNSQLGSTIAVGSSFNVAVSSALSATSFVATADYNGGANFNAINFSITASNAVQVITDAIQTVAAYGGTLGAAQNELTDIAANESVMVQNLQSSNAQIKDANMADEMVKFTQEQTLVQAGVAMLAQANQIPQYVLKLL